MDHPLIGRTLDRRYEVSAVLREVDGGVVFRAFDRMLQADVALRLVELGGDEEARKRFHRDSRIAARVRHPNVLEVRDVVRIDGADGVVTELLPGEGLGEAVRRSGPLPLEEGVEMMRQAARGLSAGHHWGLVHGALSPDRIFLSPPGEPLRVRVLGFGTVPGAALRPGEFTAPEQRAGAEPTPAADVFSLAALGVFALTGERPFRADGAPASGAGTVLFPAGWPPELAETLRRALAADPAERFRDGEELAAALDGVRPDAPASPGRRRWVPWVGVAVAAAAAVLIFAVGDRSPVVTTPEPAAELAPDRDSSGMASRAAKSDSVDALKSGIPGGTSADRTLELSAVERAPRLLNGDELARELSRRYPPLLRDAGVGGSVQVRFRILPDGSVDPGSPRVTSATHDMFVEPTLAAVRGLRFEPATVHGRPVRLWVELPIEWAVTP